MPIISQLNLGTTFQDRRLFQLQVKIYFTSSQLVLFGIVKAICSNYYKKHTNLYRVWANFYVWNIAVMASGILVFQCVLFTSRCYLKSKLCIASEQ
jgi:hypothetical protein